MFYGAGLHLIFFLSHGAVETESDRAAETDRSYQELQKDDVTDILLFTSSFKFVHIDYLYSVAVKVHPCETLIKY